jgi:hypothetical protein
MMLRFRPSTDHSPALADDPRALIAEVIRLAHFFAGPGLGLEWEHVPREEVSWEVFRGRLLDPAHTRQKRTFEAWNVYQVTSGGRSGEPLLSVKLDAPGRTIHVVRGLDSYVWEGYEDQPGVYLSRERRKWVRELVGSVALDHFDDPGELCDELIALLFHAVVGTSRLPLSSVEAPLPAFSFGELFYCHRPAGEGEGPLRSWQDLPGMLSAGLAWREKAKLLETFLHAVPAEAMGEAAGMFVGRWQEAGHSPTDLSALLRTLFNEVSLSPYTDLVEKMLAFVDALEGRGVWSAGEGIDFLGYLLRLQGRHLSAYDLVTFHHRGANYPDALLLDAVLAAYLVRIERHPELFLDGEGEGESARRAPASVGQAFQPDAGVGQAFQPDAGVGQAFQPDAGVGQAFQPDAGVGQAFQPDAGGEKGKRLRRRALRQGWLIRRQYEGHAVPDHPTSPGENNRVLPAAYPRVPEEQILQPARRRRKLYEDPLAGHLGPWGAEALRQAVADLKDPREVRELGLALFLDRPLGSGKERAEPDATPLLASEAFSPSLARRRLQMLAEELGPLDVAIPEVAGLPAEEVEGVQRPGVVSLLDARQAGQDFVFVRSARLGVEALLALFDFSPLERAGYGIDFLTGGQRVLIVPAGGTSVRIHDAGLRPRVALRPDLTGGYARRAGQEFPARGLLIERLWDADGHQVAGGAIRLLPRARPWCDG